MVSPFIKNPLGGNLGARTASFFKLDPTGTVPVESLIDLVPALNPARITIDAIDSEEKDSSYFVTTNALQDFTNAQSNVHKDLVRVTVSGVLISSVDLGLAGTIGVAGIPGFGGGLRADLLKADNLERLADLRVPIMFVSPRIDMPKAFIENVSRSWDPELGDNTIITVSLVEARIVNPLIGLDAALPDVEASATGNNALASAGAQGGSQVGTQSVNNSVSLGVAPVLMGVF
jgi:hypothetical protein